MEDVAKVVTLLASDLSAAVTGACVPVDKGTLLVPPFPAYGLENQGDINAMPTQDMLKMLAAQGKAAPAAAAASPGKAAGKK